MDKFDYDLDQLIYYLEGENSVDLLRCPIKKVWIGRIRKSGELLCLEEERDIRTLVEKLYDAKELLTRSQQD